MALEARTVSAIATATTPAADRSDGEQIEGMECVSESFTVEQEVAWVLGGTAGNRVRNGGGETQPVDAGDLIAVLFDEQPTAVELLLHPVVGVQQELVELLFVDGTEELALNASVFVGRVWWRGGSSVGSRLVALRHLFPDEFVVGAFGNRIFDRGLCFAAGVERGTATTISEVCVVAIILGGDAGLVHFVRRPFAKIQNDAFHEVSSFLEKKRAG